MPTSAAAPSADPKRAHRPPPRRPPLAIRLGFLAVGFLAALLTLPIAALAFANNLGTVSERTAIRFGASTDASAGPVGEPFGGHPGGVSGNSQAITQIVIRLQSGAITIRGSDRASVEGDRVVERALQAPTIDEHLDATPQGPVLRLESSCPAALAPWCRVSYDLSVPRGVAVDIETATGSVTVADVTGAVVVSTGAGSISLSEIAGSVAVESGAGCITARGLRSPVVNAQSGAGTVDLAFSSPPTMVQSHSGAGSVGVVVPDDGSSYRVVGGEGTTRFIDVVTDPRSSRSLDLESGAGSIRARYG